MGLTGEDKEIGDGGGFQAGVDDAPPPPPENQENSAGGPRVIRYRECLRNHAVSIGGSVTDGCGEFMPAGEEGTVASLKCAACNCHRNFHRQETPHGDGGAPPPPNPPALPSFASMTHRHNAWASLAALSPKTFGGAKPPTTAVAVSTAATATATVASSFQEPNFNPHKCFSSAPFPTPATAAPVTVASSFQEPTFNPHKCFNSAPFPSPATAAAPAPAPPSAAETRGKKRFRTKFTADQKEKMTEFADKIGWRIPREEENINGVERFCGEIGVKRQVFKVWMHNNKSSAKPNATSPSQSSSSSINN